MTCSRWVVVLSFLSLMAGCGETDKKSPGPSPVDPGDPNPAPPPAWSMQPTSGAAAWATVSAVDADRAWVGAWVEGVRRTDNGGMNWMPQDQAGFGIRKLQFLDSQNGWALSNSSVLSTSDGGQSWTVRKSATQNPFSTMCFLSASVGFVAAQNYELFKTTDGGETWTSLPVAPPEAGLRALRAVKFVNAQTGWIATSHHESGEAIFKTTDGGATWTQQHVIPQQGAVLNDVEAVDESHAWVVGSLEPGDVGELILATQNGGATWTSQQSDGSSGIRAVHFVNSSVGWAVGKHIHHTTNGGATWTLQSASRTWFEDVCFISPTIGWVVGAQGTILKTTTGGNTSPGP